MPFRHPVSVLSLLLFSGCTGTRPGDDTGTDTGTGAGTETGTDTATGDDTATDTAPDSPPLFVAAVGNGATIDVLELDAGTGSVVNLGEWPNIVAYNGFPAMHGDRLVLLGVETPQTIDDPFLSSLEPRDFTTETHPYLSDTRVADLISFNGTLYGVIGNGTGIELVSLDLTSGSGAPVGTVANMASYWPRAIVFATQVCALGESANSPGTSAIFCFDPAVPAAATFANLSGAAHAIYSIDDRVIAVRGTGTQIELHEIDPSTGIMTLLGTVPNLYEVYAPTPSGVGSDLYMLGRATPGAPIDLYRIPIDDIAATTSISIMQDIGDLILYTP